ncbi:putative ribonuclease H-like domain-containing protein [Tanacetum coccineum]
MKDSSTNPKIQAFRRELEEIALTHLGNVPENNTTSTNSLNTGSQTVNTDRLDHDDSLMPELEIFHKPETGIFDEASYDDEGVITDFNSLPTKIELVLPPTLRIMYSPKKSNTCSTALFVCMFHIQEEPKKDCEAFKDDSWVQAMQEELLQFKLQQVWVLVDLPHGMKVIGTKWVYRNKRDERGVVVRNKARLWPKGTTQSRGGSKICMDYTQAPRVGMPLYSNLYLEKHHGYKGHNLTRTLFIKKRGQKDIMLVQVFVDDIIFGFLPNKSGVLKFEPDEKADFKMSLLAAITPMETKLPLTKDEEAFDVDVHLYRSMIGSLMYLTASRPDIMHSMDERKECKGFAGDSDFHFEVLTSVYPTDGTFPFGNVFSNPQMAIFVHHLLHCIALKVVDGDLFGSNISKDKFMMTRAMLLCSIPTISSSLLIVPSSQPTPTPPPITTPTPPPITTPTPPPITTPTPPPIPTPTPLPIPSPTLPPDTEPTPLEHIYEEQSPVQHHFSPHMKQALK